MPGVTSDEDVRPFDESGLSKSGRARLRTGACVHCKSLKVRCEFKAGDKTCQRCVQSSIPCVPRTRKKRKPAPTHEDLQGRSYDQDTQIQSLLLQFDHQQLQKRIDQLISKVDSDQGNPSFHSDYYFSNRQVTATTLSLEDAVRTAFSCGPFSESQDLIPPDIVRYCQLYPEEIKELFQIFFASVNPHFSILDSELHTPESLIWTSPFLFTVICTLASRYYKLRSDIYPIAWGLTLQAAEQGVADGTKSIDICQAYLLVAVYSEPKKKWLKDRKWLLMGVGVSMAIELGLHHPPPAGLSPRSRNNWYRTWFNCYCVDGSHAVQYGRHSMVGHEDYLVRWHFNWWNSDTSLPYDVHLVAYARLLRLMEKWQHTIGEKDSLLEDVETGKVDVIMAALDTASKLDEEMDKWSVIYQEQLYRYPSLECTYRGNNTRAITSYLRLTVLAIAFPYAVKSGITRDSPIVREAISAARRVIQITLEILFPTGQLRYAMEANFVFVSFAAAFLTNLLRPKFLPLLFEDEQRTIVNIVQKLINTWSSREVAVNDRHMAAQYARFLHKLLVKQNVRTTPEPDAEGDADICAQYNDDRRQSPPHQASWPDVAHFDGGFETSQADDTTLGNIPEGIFQRVGEPDMNFSMNHFVQTVEQDDHSYYTIENAEIPGQDMASWYSFPEYTLSQ